MYNTSTPRVRVWSVPGSAGCAAIAQILRRLFQMAGIAQAYKNEKDNGTVLTRTHNNERLQKIVQETRKGSGKAHGVCTSAVDGRLWRVYSQPSAHADVRHRRHRVDVLLFETSPVKLCLKFILAGP